MNNFSFFILHSFGTSSRLRVFLVHYLGDLGLWNVKFIQFVFIRKFIIIWHWINFDVWFERHSIRRTLVSLFLDHLKLFVSIQSRANTIDLIIRFLWRDIICELYIFIRGLAVFCLFILSKNNDRNTTLFTGVLAETCVANNVPYQN